MLTRKERRKITDTIMARSMQTMTALSLLILILIGAGLLMKSLPILRDHSYFELLTSSNWKPSREQFGFLPFIMGTLWVAAIALIISFPLCLLTSVYLSEYATVRLKKAVTPMVDLLAGIPPVVYGVWGILVIVPFIADTLASRFVEYSSGYTVLAGGIVLAIMIFPLIISLLLEVFSSIPRELRDASLSLGATKWQTSKHVIIRKSTTGIIAAAVLAISRGLGETIAVLMVVGNIVMIPHSVFDSGYPLAALIANNYGEMFSIPLYESALMLVAFTLFIIIVFFNIISRWILSRVERSNLI